MSWRLEFVNHASVLVEAGSTGLRTDPWYEGPAFHDGWNLIVETPPDEVRALLRRVTHIWVSHEHPDHFAPAFFKAHGNTIRDRGIELIFQKIADQRVAGFLRAQGFRLTEMVYGRAHDLGDMTATCLKDEWYDSALSIRIGDTHILNLNDCAVTTEARAREIRNAVGPCDLLLSQFSYAAWKGGRENRAWRAAAAAEKLDAIDVQARVLEPKLVVPFASFVWFSHERNFYLNDAANTPAAVAERFAGAPFTVAVLKPGDRLPAEDIAAQSAGAVAWWQARYDTIDAPRQRYETVLEDRLDADFAAYLARIRANNSPWFMRLARRLSPIRILQPVVVHLDDLDRAYEIDIIDGRFAPTEAAADLSMASASLDFLFRNSFGFDTLGVNGCFEERRPGGFARAAKTLAIETLNNLGIAFGPGLLLERRVIGTFLSRMAKIRRRLRA